MARAAPEGGGLLYCWRRPPWRSSAGAFATVEVGSMVQLIARVVVLVLLLGSLESSEAERITVWYEAEAATVVDAPLGIEVPRLTLVTGTFTFETSTPDVLPEDPETGDYPHQTGGGGFTASFLEHTLTGSATPLVEIRPNSDTFRFIDGPGTFGDEGGIMSIDGSPNEAIELWFSAGTETEMVDDSLINPFPFYDFDSFVGTPHTFSIADDNGTMLLQMTKNTITLNELTCGDLDGNGAIAASDALRLLQRAVGVELTILCPVLDGAIPCGDLDDNGVIAASDALRLLQRAVGVQLTLTCAS
jgi:hypothetical protein